MAKEKSDKAPVRPGQITVVIPYSHDKAQGDELKYALRSWKLNFIGKINVVIIGDREAWFSKDITHIPFESVSDNPQLNQLEMLRIAVASAEVSDRFIWSNDDIYLWQPVTLAHLQIPKHTGPFNPGLYGEMYREAVIRTRDLIRACGVDEPLYFGTHTPYVFDKTKVVEMFERFPQLAEEAYLFESVYFNFSECHPILVDWRRDSWCASIVSPDPSPERFDAFTRDKCIINNAETGYSPFFVSKLAERYPLPSRFELCDD